MNNLSAPSNQDRAHSTRKVMFSPHRRWVRLLILGVAMAWASAPALEVDERLPPFQPLEPSQLQGTLRIVGSDVMVHMLTGWAERFVKGYPEVKIELIPKGSRAGPPALTSGEAPIIAMTRSMTNAEMEAFTHIHGHAPTAIPVAGEMIGVFVHKDNPIADKGLTLAQIDAIFGRERRRGHPVDITTWGELGLEGEWKNLPIVPYGRNSASVTYGVFKHMALLQGDYKKTIRELSGGSLIASVAVDRAGITFSGSGYLRDTIRAVPLARDPGSEPVPLDPKQFADYPLSRPFLLYVNHGQDGGLAPTVAEFLRLIFSREGQMEVVRDGNIPLDFETGRRELDKVRIKAHGVD